MDGNEFYFKIKFVVSTLKKTNTGKFCSTNLFRSNDVISFIYFKHFDSFCFTFSCSQMLPWTHLFFISFIKLSLSASLFITFCWVDKILNEFINRIIDLNLKKNAFEICNILTVIIFSRKTSILLHITKTF